MLALDIWSVNVMTQLLYVGVYWVSGKPGEASNSTDWCNFIFCWSNIDKESTGNNDCWVHPSTFWTLLLILLCMCICFGCPMIPFSVGTGVWLGDRTGLAKCEFVCELRIMVFIVFYFSNSHDGCDILTRTDRCLMGSCLATIPWAFLFSVSPL